MGTTAPVNHEALSEPLKSTRATAAYLGVSMATLDRWSSQGIGPRFFKLGRDRRYRPEDVVDVPPG